MRLILRCLELILGIALIKWVVKTLRSPKTEQPEQTKPECTICKKK